MKKLVMMFAAFVLAVSTVNAQSGNNGNQQRTVDRTEMVKNRTDRFVKQYGLNEDQAKQLLALNTAYADKMPGMGRMGQGRRGQQNNGESDSQERPSREQMEARMKEMRANMEAYDGELKKILTSDQYAKYQEDQKQRMQRRGQGQGQGMGGQRRGGNFGNSFDNSFGDNGQSNDMQ